MKQIIEEIKFENNYDWTKYHFIETKNPNGLYRITITEVSGRWCQRWFYNNKEITGLSYNQLTSYIKYEFRNQKMNKIFSNK